MTIQIHASSVAAAISDATDVHAVAENSYVGGAAVSSGTISGSATNYIKINGVDIGAVDVLASDTSKALSTAINSTSDLTGVSASVDSLGILTLTSVDGGNIAVDAAGAGQTISDLTANTTTVTATANTALSSTSVTSVTLTAGELVINGVDMAGTYGNGGVGSSEDELKAAIQAIDGLSTSTISAGVVIVKTNEGIDININANSTAANGDNVQFAAASVGIFNGADKGTVIMYADDPIQVSTTDENDNVMNDYLGFDGGTLRTAKTIADDNLTTIDVTNRRSAELAILISDSALKQLDATRSDLGSVQNQLQSTIRNISVTQVNVSAAESQIRDVDFAAESANFAKLNILAQSGSYAMSQANAVQQNVMRLLQ